MENSGELEVRMPCLLSYPLRKGRKAVTIPDTTQFSGVTQCLFGVPCATPEEAYYMGTYNELYLLHLHVPPYLRDQIPSKVLARVSRDDKTRSDMSMESEVSDLFHVSSGQQRIELEIGAKIATMVFVRSRTDIPVPTVYGYCPTRDNAIGQPFSGASCISYVWVIGQTEGCDMSSSVWEDLSLDNKLRSIRDYASIVYELSKLRFDRIGSIYFKSGVTPHYYELGPVTWCKHESGPRRKSCHYDRGPWKASAAWLRAALSDEIAFMEKLPHLAWSTYKCRRDDESRWWLAQQVLPQLHDRVADVIEDPLDRCGAGPFVLAHMDFCPQNIIISPEGANAGRILSVIDWEMSSTVPLWALVCYPSWFGRVGPNAGKRHPSETQLFKDTYIRELQRLTREPFILTVVQNPRSESKRRFADVATLPWPMVHTMAEWIEKNAGKR